MGEKLSKNEFVKLFMAAAAERKKAEEAETQDDKDQLQDIDFSDPLKDIDFSDPVKGVSFDDPLKGINFETAERAKNT